MQVQAGKVVVLSWKVSNAPDGVELTDPAKGEPEKLDSSTSTSEVTPAKATQDYKLVAVAGSRKSDPKTVHVSTHPEGHVYSPHMQVLPPGQPPQVNYFRIAEKAEEVDTAKDTLTAAAGAKVFLAWEVEGDVKKVEIDQNVGDVTDKTTPNGETSGDGTVEVTLPAKDTVYTLKITPAEAKFKPITKKVMAKLEAVKPLKIVKFVIAPKEEEKAGEAKKEEGKKEEGAVKIPANAKDSISLAAGDKAVLYWEVEGDVEKAGIEPLVGDVTEDTTHGEGTVSYHEIEYGPEEGAQEAPKEFTLTLQPKGGGKALTAKVKVVQSLKDKLDEHKELFELLSTINFPAELFADLKKQITAANKVRGGVSKVLSGKGVVVWFFNTGFGGATFKFFDTYKDEFKEFSESAEKVADLLDLLINVIELGTTLQEWWEGKKQGKDALIAVLKALQSAVTNMPKSMQKKLRRPLIQYLGKNMAKKLPGLADKAMDFIDAVPITIDVIEDWWKGDKGKLLKDLPDCAEKLGPPVVGELVHQATRSESAGKLAKWLCEKGAKALNDLGKEAVAAAEGAFESEARAITANAKWQQLVVDHAMAIGLDRNEGLHVQALNCIVGGDKTRRLISSKLWALKNPDVAALREILQAFDALQKWFRTAKVDNGWGGDAYAPVASVFDQMAGLPPEEGVSGKVLDWLGGSGYGAQQKSRDAVMAQYPGWRESASNAQNGCTELGQQASGLAKEFYTAFNEDQELVLQVVPKAKRK